MSEGGRKPFNGGRRDLMTINDVRPCVAVSEKNAPQKRKRHNFGQGG